MSGALSTYEYKKKYSYFSGKKKDWIPWEEKYLAKSRRYGYKDLRLGRLTILKSSELLNPVEDEAELKIWVLNEDAYSGLIRSIDTTTSAGKVAFSLVRGTKSADYDYGNAEIASRDWPTKLIDCSISSQVQEASRPRHIHNLSWRSTCNHGGHGKFYHR
jgi:hypothetical protein